MNVVIPMKSSVAGWFKFEKGKVDADGNPIESTREVVADWFPNLILDCGLDSIGTRSISLATRCVVGSGNTPPAESQEQLISFVGATTSTIAVSGGNSSTSPYYSWTQITYRFDAGVAAGNLSEVGVGNFLDDPKLYSRALILDGDGDPTTITVLPDEFLDVTYQGRSYHKEDEGSTTVTISGVEHDITWRGADVLASLGGLAGIMLNFGSPGGMIAEASSTATDFVAITSRLANRVAYSSLSAASYTAGDYYRDFTFVWNLSLVNPTTMVEYGGPMVGRFQAKFDPAIATNNTKKLTLTFRMSWDRYTPP